MQILHNFTPPPQFQMKTAAKLSPLWDLYTDEKSASVSPTSLDTDYRQARRWFSQCPYQDPADWRKAMGWVLRREPRLSAIKIGRYLKAMARWAASPDVALIHHNPVQSFAFPKRPQSEHEPIVIPAAELPLVMLDLNTTKPPSPRWGLIAQIMLQTGLRTGEVFAIHKDDIRGNQLFVHRNWTITRALKDSTKTNRSRLVPLNTIAMEILKSMEPSADGFLFPLHRKSFESFFYERMKRLYAKGLIRHRYRPYDLRHTHISRCLEAGVPVTQVAAWAGNSPAVIWDSYANTSQNYEMPVIQ